MVLRCLNERGSNKNANFVKIEVLLIIHVFSSTQTADNESANRFSLKRPEAEI